MNADRRHRALITRPQEDSADVAIALARRGVTPMLAPMMSIEYLPAEIDDDVVAAQAVLFTSRNGVRAFSRTTGLRDLPVYTVGDSTADLARENGFSEVHSAGGDSADLAQLVQQRLTAEDGPLFHAAGVTITAGLAETLTAAGYMVNRSSLYDAKPVGTLSDETADAVRGGEADYVLFFSPRTARIFLELAREAGLLRACKNLTAICLSDAVSGELNGFDWKEIAVASEPTTVSLIAAVERLQQADAPAASPVPEILSPRPGPKPPAEELPQEQTSPLEPPPLGEPLSFLRPDEEETSTGSSSAETEEPEADTPDIEEQTEERAEPEPRPLDPHPPEGEDAPDEGPKDMTPPPKNTESAAAAAPPPARRGSGGFAWSLLGGVAVLAVAYATLPMWRGYLPQSMQSQLAGPTAQSQVDAETKATITSLKQDNAALRGLIDQVNSRLQNSQVRLADAEMLTRRLAKSEAALEQLKQAQVKAVADAAAPNPLTDRIARLEAKLAETEKARMEAEAGAGAGETRGAALSDNLKSTIDTLSARIAELEKRLSDVMRVSAAAGKENSFALAAGQLRDALSRSEPFAAELATLKKLGSAVPAIAKAIGTIEAAAGEGVPSRSALFARLPAVIDAVVAASRAPEQGDWMDRALAKLRGFVSVRRIDGRGHGVDAAIARAEKAARSGDLSAAVAELSKMDGAAANAASDWLAGAHSRISADAVRAELNKIVLSELAAGG